MSVHAITWLGVLLICIHGPVRSVLGNRLENRRTVEDFLNVCMLGINHKRQPGQEPSLQPPCNRWKDNACCHPRITESVQHEPGVYNFSLSHCEGHTLSDRCRKHFTDDTCFYECSPNLGPWLVSVKPTSSWRRERFVGVPLCESECIMWWEDCKRDFTCRDNWSKGFDWSSGTNVCPPESTCKTFVEVFGNAKTFCENVWDGDFKVLPDTHPCMKLSWTGINPNDAVAAARAKELADSISGGCTVKPLVTCFVWAIVLFCLELCALPITVYN